MSHLKIHNVMTNIVGRTKTERIVSKDIWDKDIQPVLNSLLEGPDVKRHKALIGRWVVEYIGNDPHMFEFFSKNWKHAHAGAQAHVTSYVVNGIRDREKMKQLLGLRSEADVRAHLESFLKAIESKKYRSTLRDEKLRNIDQYPPSEQLEIALFAPATIYSAERHAFASLNTNYYGQLKSKSSLGPLEEYLIRHAERDSQGRIANPGEVWLSMHAGCVEYRTDAGAKRGIVVIAPTGTGKSTHCYGLVEAKPENKLHSDDWVFVNLGSREVIISEDQFYMRTNISGIFPHLIPLLVCQPLENVAFTPEMVALLEQFGSAQEIEKAIQTGQISRDEYQKLIEQMVETNAARSLIDPRLMVGREKFIEKTTLSDIFLFKRDYDSLMILQTLSPEEGIEVLTSKDNVFNYDYGKLDPDGYGIAQARTTEIYYNPYLCQLEVDREKGIYGELDQIRMEAYRTLMRERGVSTVWVNTRLPASQTQLCLHRFLEGGVDSIRLKKGEEVDDQLLAKLGLVKKEKPATLGRRPHDRIGFFDGQGREAEIVAFYLKDKLLETRAFLKDNQTKQ